MSERQTGTLMEWVIPFAFVVCTGFVVWQMPAFILDLLPKQSESLFAQISDLHARKEITPNLPPLFEGGHADILDWAALIMIPILFVVGARGVRVAGMEFQDYRAIDRIALFVGRVTMMLILSMTCVMLYEVFLRYVLEAPTKWANELTLWIAGFVFLCSGFYGMQQRSHIRIFIIYEMLPKWGRHICDVISTFFICAFAAALVFGSYKQVFVNKFYKWEMFGTAFDPPIPATIQPMILIIICLVAAQSVINLISDWNAEPEVHDSTAEIDEEEIEAIKRSLGEN